MSEPYETATFLDMTADDMQREGERLIQQIEAAERDLVRLRDERDTKFRRMAEARTAANILRDVGLRSSMTDRGPLVEVDYQPQPPSSPGAS